jgi:hypothetical protein
MCLSNPFEITPRSIPENINFSNLIKKVNVNITSFDLKKQIPKIK